MAIYRTNSGEHVLIGGQLRVLSKSGYAGEVAGTRLFQAVYGVLPYVCVLVILFQALAAAVFLYLYATDKFAALVELAVERIPITDVSPADYLSLFCILFGFVFVFIYLPAAFLGWGGKIMRFDRSQLQLEPWKSFAYHTACFVSGAAMTIVGMLYMSTTHTASVLWGIFSAFGIGYTFMQMMSLVVTSEMWSTKAKGAH